ITVHLEELASKLVEVRADFTSDPPFGYQVIGEPLFDVNQVMVSGPRAQVEQVAAVRVEIDLERQTGVIEDFARPIPVDADGNPVSDVTVDTQVIGFTVQVGQVEG